MSKILCHNEISKVKSENSSVNCFFFCQRRAALREGDPIDLSSIHVGFGANLKSKSSYFEVKP